MKTKYNSIKDLLTDWYVNDEIEQRRTWNSIFTEKNCIYSYGYHYIIAKKENNLLFLNTEKVSRTTSKHTSLIKNWANTSYRNNIKILLGFTINDVLINYVKNLKKETDIVTYNFLLKNKKKLDTTLLKENAWLFKKENNKIINLINSENSNVKQLGINILKQKKLIA